METHPEHEILFTQYFDLIGACMRNESVVMTKKQLFLLLAFYSSSNEKCEEDLEVI